MGAKTLVKHPTLAETPKIVPADPYFFRGIKKHQ